MATQERARTTNGIVRKLGIIALGASFTLAACGASQALSGTVQTSSDGRSVLSDPENPYYSRNTTVVETSAQRSTLADSENPYWSRNTAAPSADDTVDQPHPRPY